MRIHCVKPSELSQQEIVAWDALQQGDAAFDSPFFSPYFTLAVAAARADVRVTIIDDAGRLGFFPFQAHRWGIGRAVGWRLNDFQGAIVPQGLAIDPRRLLSASGLRSWRFDHIIPSDDVVRHVAFSQHVSPVIDLKDGFAAYCQSRQAACSGALKQTWRKQRKLGREVGEVRLVVHSSSDEVMSQLATWKTAQLRRNGSLSIFDIGWMRTTIDALRNSQAHGCRGQLSALYSGERLVAAHLGIRSANVLHWWITAYNPEYETYSPGAILLLQLTEAAASENVQRIDLGKGDETYKQRFMTGATLVGEGTLCNSLIADQWSRALHRMRQFACTSSLRNTVRRVKRIVREAVASPKSN